MRVSPAGRPALQVRDLRKSFTLHGRNGLRLPVLAGTSLAVRAGECVLLSDPSGAGKSTLLRSIYGNYRPQDGAILLRHRDRVVDMVGAEPRLVLEVRRWTLGYVSQFLRVVPRVPAIEVVAEPLRRRGMGRQAARERARGALAAVGIPERLWDLSPVTFSGGEQQRVNLARVFAVGYPVLLLDEPTASLDAASRRVAIDLIRAARDGGAAVLGSVHDADVRDAVATRVVGLTEAAS
jgi:alpha-D-ribose 1-methylphosphonate 5-triphosphate synthase subunit PhnL